MTPEVLIVYCYHFFRRIGKIAKRDYWLLHICLSVRFNIFRKSAEKIQFLIQYDKNESSLHVDRCASMAISCLILRKLRNTADKIM